MEKHEFFEREIQLIQSEDLRDFVRWFFDVHVGEWFWKSGASSTGKYHPQFTKGEGGLVKHTRAVVMVCDELLRMSSYAYMRAEYKDYAIAACLLHDTRKYGSGDAEDKGCYAQHGKLAAEDVAAAWEEFFRDEYDFHPCPELLLMAIRSHMGQWVEDKEDRPFTNIDRLVHLSDYIASRPFWDIPKLNQEYTADRNTEYFSQHPAEAAAFGFAL